MDLFFKAISQKFNPPRPTTESFSGQTILITGVTSGLGLAAAKKIIALSPEKLIITARTLEKAQKAKNEIKVFSSTKLASIIPMVLDMSNAEGIKSFVKDLKSHTNLLHSVILNAGVIQTTYKVSQDGWEEAIQVNTISSIHLAILLLPMFSGPNPHMTFSSSTTIWLLKPETMQNFVDSENPISDFSAKINFPPGPIGGNTQYSRSKLTTEYALRRIASDLLDHHNEPKIIINSVCPGMCNTDIGRNFSQVGIHVRIALWLTFNLLGRSPTQGANIYLSSLKQDKSIHGQMWVDDKIHQPGPMITTAEGKKLEKAIWRELTEIMKRIDPETIAILSSIRDR